MSAGAFERLSRWLTLAMFSAAITILAAAPLLAWSWNKLPFPGFMVEQSLVVTENDGVGWHGRRAGLAHPQRVVEVEGRAVTRAADFQAILEKQSPENPLSLRTMLPDGSTISYPPVMVTPFQTKDLIRLFGVPYTLAFVYLALGFWVYTRRGQTTSGAAFANFCASTSLMLGLIFDLTTTHAGTAVWTLVLALQGSLVIGLAMLLPVERAFMQQRRWILLLPYVVSAALAGWSLHSLFLSPDPWAYIDAWRASYLYAAAGIAVLFGAMMYHQFKGGTAQVRQQARVIGWGSVFSFSPLGVWFSAPVLGIYLPFNNYLLLMPMLIFPAFLAVAILRYRLWDVEVIINRTLVYGALTVLIGGIYTIGVLASQRIFDNMTGNSTPLGIAVSTLGIALLFQPLRRNVQNLIDRQFYRKKYDAARTIASFGATLRDLADTGQVAARLRTVAMETLNPTHTGVWLKGDEFFELTPGPGELLPVEPDRIPLDDPLPAHLGRADGAEEIRGLNLDSPGLERLRKSGFALILPLVSQGELLGWVGFGPQAGDQGYSADDRALIDNLARQAAPAVRVVLLLRKREAEVAERERLEYELAVARKIQHALLPRALPHLHDWQCAVHYQPARQIGGDFYDFLTLPDGRIFFCVGDVVDKGIPAALVMAAARTILRTVARQTESPGEALARTNELLHPELPPGIFVTCLIGLLDPESGALELANAGHSPALHLQPGTSTLLRVKGMPLGLMPAMSYEVLRLVIQPGELLLAYSDGLVEAHNPIGEIFGQRRLQDIVAQGEPDCSRQIERLLAALSDFTGPSWQQEDDVTLVALARQAVPASLPSPAAPQPVHQSQL